MQNGQLTHAKLPNPLSSLSPFLAYAPSKPQACPSFFCLLSLLRHYFKSRSCNQHAQTDLNAHTFLACHATHDLLEKYDNHIAPILLS